MLTSYKKSEKINIRKLWVRNTFKHLLAYNQKRKLNFVSRRNYKLDRQPIILVLMCIVYLVISNVKSNLALKCCIEVFIPHDQGL